MRNEEKPGPGIPWYRRPGGVTFIHVLRVVLLGFVAGPLVASSALVLGEAVFVLPTAFLVGIFFGGLCTVGPKLPPEPPGRYVFPLFFCWVMFFAFFPFILTMSFGSGRFTSLRFLPDMYIWGLVLASAFFEQRRKDRVRFEFPGWFALGVFLFLPLVHIVYGTCSDTAYAAKRGHGFERVGGFSSTDLKPYDPRVPGAVTSRLQEPSSLLIRGAEHLPVLDGAEAAFPVYAAFAAACYPDLPPLTEEELRTYDYRGIRQGALRFNNTIFAFQYLIEGKVDVFFGAHPSKRQMEDARTHGRELVLTPIGKEAFVFFVNEANRVNGLTSRQIRDIYSGRVRNWKGLGGADVEVVAFQRPEGSGSQTIMHRFMGDTKMEAPLQDRYVGGMGGIVERTSEYRNAPSAIGYSFRFFLTGLGKQPRIKTLAVDGVSPTPETIRSGEYPHVVNLYAITVKDNPNPNVAPFVSWMLSKQGQELVEKVGYVRVD